MAKVLGKMSKADVIEAKPVKDGSLRILQSFDTSHIVDDSKVKTVEVNINDIKEKENNNFIKSKIEELAKSIKEVGLQQPIVLKKTNLKNEKGNTIYEVVAGHRRLEAYKLLNNEYGDTKYAEDNPYLKIQARILKNNADDEKIYLQTNSTARNTTLFEAILNCDLNEIDFANEDFKEKYNKIFYPDGTVPEKEKYNDESINKYLEKIIKSNFPNLEDIKVKTIKNQKNLIKKLCPECINAILEGKLSIGKAETISRFNKIEQPGLLAKVLNGEVLKNKPAEESEVEIKDSYKEMMKVDKQLKKILNTNLNGLDTKGWNGNAKEYLKQMKKVIKEIEILEKMKKN